MTYCLTALILFVAVTLSVPCCGQTGPAQIPPGPLGDFDVAFLTEYISTIKSLEEMHPTYVEIAGNDLILHHDGQEQAVRVLPDIYHALKDVAHVPFTVYLVLSRFSRANHTFTLEQISQLQDLSAKISSARNALDTGNFEGSQLLRQQRMIDPSLELLRGAIRDKRIDRATLQRFARTMGPLMMANSDEAGCYQVREMHSQMMKWKTVITEAQWDSLVAINRSSHQPRYRNVATQYFGWLFDLTDPKWAYPGESERLIYTEAPPKGLSSEDLLLSISIDADASFAFFGDRWRLSEDILSDGAARCIAQLPVADRPWHK